MLSKNQKIELYIDGYTAEGSGVGHFDGIAVFVACAAQGDTIIAHIIKSKKNYAVGKIVKILKPSDDRIAVDCPYFSSCGGCAYRHISYEAEKHAKEQRVKDAFLRLAHLQPEFEPLVGGETCGYRNKAQFPVGFDKTLKIGFYAPRTHRITDCPSCLLQPVEFSEIVSVIRKWIIKNGISVYDEQINKGLFRHIYLRKAEETGEIMVCAVINGETLPKSESLVSELLKNNSIKTICININKEKTNVILGEKCVTLYGDGFITDILCGNKIRIAPLSFYQVNRKQAQRLYEKAKDFACLTGKETVLDLYCGAGTIGLSLAKKAKKIIGVEIVKEAVEDARFNAESNNINNAEFFCGDASKAAEMLKNRGEKPEVIVIDPPRKGCDEALIDTIAYMNPERVVYVSCDPATLARDCALFGEKGYETKKVAPFDLFPRTIHIENIALLERRNT